MKFRPNRPRASVNIALTAIIIIAFANAAQAQMTPVGTWRSVDDATRAPKAQIVVSDHGGVLSGRIEQLLRPGADLKAVCDKCSDDRKGQPITGMEIIRGMKASGGGKYAGGTILKPDEGKVYKSKMQLTDGGKTLEVSGCIAFICKSQTWLRQ